MGRVPRTRGAVATVAVVLTLGVSVLSARPASAATSSDFMTCGRQVTESIVLGNNLECSGAAFFIMGPDVTIDLNGHRIAGDGGAGDVGINNEFDQPGLTVRNGTIAGFQTGIYNEGEGATFEDLVVAGQTGTGIVAYRAHGTRVRRSVLTRNTEGIRVTASNDVEVAENTVAAHAEEGIAVVPDTTATGSERATVASNRVVASGGAGTVEGSGISIIGGFGHTVASNETALSTRDGIRLTDTYKNLVKGNRVIGNNFDGIKITGATATFNQIVSNRATGNGRDGISLGSGSNMVEENTSSANDRFGIWVSSGEDNDVFGNKTHENGASGIWVDGTFTTLRGNKSNANGYLNGFVGDNPAGDYGIAVVAGNSGSNNAVAQNDNDAQCAAPQGMCDVGSKTTPTGIEGCGDVISSSLRLRNNLSGCTTDHALLVNKANITIDLGGHRLDGDGSGVGIRNGVAAIFPGFAGVTMKNGVFDRFTQPVLLIDAKDNAVRNSYFAGGNLLTVAMVRFSGTEGSSASGNTFASQFGNVLVDDDAVGSTVANNFFTGLGGPFAHNSTRTTFSANTIVGGEGTGAGFGATNVRITGNRIFGPRNIGIGFVDVGGPDVAGGAISGNRVTGAGGQGILLDAQSSNVGIGSNVITANGGDGLDIAGDDVRIRSNTVLANSGSGIFLRSSADRAKVAGNAAHHNGVHGIFAGTNGARLTDNRANFNGYLAPNGFDGIGLGIAANGLTSGSGNRAAGNDDPANCVPAELCRR